MIEAGEFLEWADVFGNLYGTCGPETERLLSAGRDVVLVIDVQGAQQVRECGLAFVSIFVLPPSFTVLEQRLRGRSKDSDAAIRRRLEVASSEVSGYHDYDYVIVNDELDVAVDALRAIVMAERARVNRMRPVADAIINTFPKRDQDWTERRMALIAVGVSGGVGAYKAAEVVRGLQKRGHDVVAILTRGAQQFVTPLTFEALTRRAVITDQWAPGTNTDVGHISLTTEVAALVVAPATANLIAKLAHGLADDFLTTFALATRCPILLAPAMNTQMLAHPAVEANLATLRGRGVRLIEPGAATWPAGGSGRAVWPSPRTS